MQSNVFSINKTLNLGGRIVDLSTPKVMGILNVTPDSFYDGNKHNSVSAAIRQCEIMLNEGADFIDVGGYSSRPGADNIDEAEEIKRVAPVIKALHDRFPETFISIDTFRSCVAEVAVGSGASLINDISAGALDPLMHQLVAKLQVPYVAMHMKGTPQTMAQQTQYQDLIGEVLDYFHPKIHRLHALAVKDIIVDVGFGFAKTVPQNFELLRSLEVFHMLGKPLMVGLSRKSMIWKTLNLTPAEALNGTTSLHTIALMKGASILRAHDVKEAVEAIKLVSFVK